MVINASIIAITVLISTLFISLTQQQVIALSSVMLLVHFYCRLPKMIIIVFVTLMVSLFHENKVIYSANQSFTQSLVTNKQAWNKSFSDHTITAEIITLVNSKNGLRFNVSVQRTDGERENFISPIIRLYWFNNNAVKNQHPLLGQVWRFKVRLKALNANQQSQFYSYPHHLLSQNIIHSGFVLQAELLDEDTSLRQDYFKLIKRLLPENANPLLLALTFGYRAEITESQWLQYQQFGISHLIAISGLHVGLLFGFCIVVINLVSCIFKKPISVNTNLLTGLVFSVVYVWLAGFSLPAMRALILLAISCCYRILGYKVTLGQICIYMLLVTVVISPYSIYGVSFILSFYAIICVFVLAWWLVRNTHYYDNKQRYYLSIISLAVKTQLMLFLLLLPAQIAIFSGFSWLSFIANLLLIPIFSLFILPVLLIAVLVAPVIPDLSKFIFTVLQFGFNYFDQTLVFISQNTQPWIELSLFSHDSFSLFTMLAIYIGLILLFLLKPICNYLLPLIGIAASVVFILSKFELIVR